MDRVINYFNVRGLFEEATTLQQNTNHPVVVATLDIINFYSEDKRWVQIPYTQTSFDRMLAHLVAEASGFYSMTQTTPDRRRPRSPGCKVCVNEQYRHGTTYVYIGSGCQLVDTISKKNRGQKTTIYQERRSRRQLPTDQRTLGPMYKSMKTIETYTLTKKVR